MKSFAPFIPHSPESFRAAVSIECSRVTLRRSVYRDILYSGDHGRTDDELQVRLSMNPSTERPRRIELWEAGLIRSSGRTRNTRSGRKAIVWIATGENDKSTGRAADLRRQAEIQQTFKF
jgi:hypothetical protein